MSEQVKWMKNIILREYNNAEAWKDRVNKMSDKQIQAVYYSIVERRRKKMKENKQPSLFDLEKQGNIN